MSYCPLFKICFLDFSWLYFQVSEWRLVTRFYMKSSIWKVTDQVWLSSRLTKFFKSYCPLFKIRFPNFSRLCFHISEWKLVASFHKKSYRSSSTFVAVDLLFHDLLPFAQNSFSRLFSAMFSHIWMKIGSKLPYEELQIKFDFRHGWPTFSWVTSNNKIKTHLKDAVIEALLY